MCFGSLCQERTGPQDACGHGDAMGAGRLSQIENASRTNRKRIVLDTQLHLPLLAVINHDEIKHTALLCCRVPEDPYTVQC